MVARAKSAVAAAKNCRPQGITVAKAIPVSVVPSVIGPPVCIRDRNPWGSYTPLTKSTNAVTVQTTMVSIKISAIPHIPCTWGDDTCVLAWARTEEPSPASLEKIPLAIPMRTACPMPYPAIPPAAACTRNASVTISRNASGIRSR